MGIIDDIRAKYEELDVVDRQKLWIGVIFAILLVFLFLSLNDAVGTISKVLGGGASYVNQSVSDGAKLVKK